MSPHSIELALLQPQIAPNVGNVARLCVATGTRLHLVRPLGFELEDRQLRRAGLDYHELTCITVHRDWDACAAALVTIMATYRAVQVQTPPGEQTTEPLTPFVEPVTVSADDAVSTSVSLVVRALARITRAVSSLVV